MGNTIKHTAKPGLSTAESLLNTVYWLAFFLFVMPFIAEFLVILIGLLVVPAAPEAAEGEGLATSPVYWAITASVTAALLYPFLKYPMYTRSTAITFERLGFTTIRIRPLLLTLLATCGFIAFETLAIIMADIEEPAFVLELAAQMNSVTNILMLFLATVIIAPVVEETIFRGIVFYRLKNTRLGVSGAIVFPSIIFTAIHFQYEQACVFLLIFLSSIMLGVIRHSTNNLWYCILGHMVMNLLVFIELLADAQLMSFSSAYLHRITGL